jgi:intracellular septation protein A
MPAPRRLLRDVSVHLGEAVVVPLALFYVVLVTVGMTGALAAALAWAYAAIVVRLLRRERPSALLVVGTVFATARVGITALSGSAVVYFLQPALTTVLFGLALLLTVALDRPLIQRLAHEFCPLPPHVLRTASLRRFFQRLSLLWAAVLLCNSALTLLLLVTIPVVDSVPLSAGTSLPLFLLALALSLRWFRRSLHLGGFRLAWGA